MISLGSVELVINVGASGNEEINQNVKVITSTPVGSLAFDRDFGIDMSLLDNPIPIAQGLITVELIEKIRKYEPRVNVKEIIFASKDEIIVPRIILEIVWLEVQNVKIKWFTWY